MKRDIICNVCALACVMMALNTAPAPAQTLASGYFLEGNLQRSMLNPAFAGDHNYLAFPMLSNVSVGMNANVGLSDFLYPTQRQGYALTTFMSGSVDAEDFLNRIPDMTRLLPRFDLTALAAGFRCFGGYATARVSLHGEMGVAIPEGFFALAKQGLQNSHYSFSGLGMSALAYGDVALGYSHPIDDNLRIGATVHALIGGAMADVELSSLELTMDETAWMATVEASGQAAVTGTINGSLDDGGDISYTPGVNALGAGLDLGAEYDLDDVVSGLSVSAALTGLGSIGWKTVAKGTTPKETFHYEGFGEVDPDNLDMEGQLEQMGDDMEALLDFDYTMASKTRTHLAPVLSVGAEYEMPFYNKLSAGVLLRKRFSSMTGFTDARLFANVAPLKWLDLSANVGVSSFGTEMGWMLDIHPKGIAFFIGSDYMVFRVTPQYLPVEHCNVDLCMGVNITF